MRRVFTPCPFLAISAAQKGLCIFCWINNYSDVQTGRWGIGATAIRLLGTRSLLDCRERRAGHKPGKVDSNAKGDKSGSEMAAAAVRPAESAPHRLMLAPMPPPNSCFVHELLPGSEAPWQSLACSGETGVTCVPGWEEKAWSGDSMASCEYMFWPKRAIKLFTNFDWNILQES